MGYILKVYLIYPEMLDLSHSDLPFLPEKMKIDQQEKAICKCDKKGVANIRNLQQALNHGLKLEKINRGIKFNEKERLKPHIKFNNKLKKCKN